MMIPLTLMTYFIDPDLLTGGCDSSSNPGSDNSVEDLLIEIACPAPRRIIGDSGAAKHLGNKDLSSDCVINTVADAANFDAANGLVFSNKE
eukprot:11446088-Heterocapsa_arctica.AAC.1